MKTVKPERPGGFLDFGPKEFLAREDMLRIISNVFRSYGYNQVETPIVEFTKVLTGTDDTSKNIFSVIGRNSNEEEGLAMRFDHTVPLARYLSANPYDDKTRTGIKLPWRRMVVGPVFRSDTPQKGRYRQFYQFDADIAGCSSMLADAEIIMIMYDTLNALGVERFTIRINNRKILNGLADLLGITDRTKIKAEDITKEVMRILDKIPKIGMPAAFDELSQEPMNDFDISPGLKPEALEILEKFLAIGGSNAEKISQALELFKNILIAEEGLSELVEIIDYLDQLEIPKSTVEIDFSVARGLDYYTGPVFETTLLDAPEFGSVFSGGRYNDLVARFTGRELPAVGASIGVDRLFTALQQLGVIKIEEMLAEKILILRLSKTHDYYYLKLAERLRKAGQNVELSFLEDTTFKSQFNFAVSQGVNFIIIAGLEEINNHTIKIKNLFTRQQEEVPEDQLTEYFNPTKNRS